MNGVDLELFRNKLLFCFYHSELKIIIIILQYYLKKLKTKTTNNHLKIEKLLFKSNYYCYDLIKVYTMFSTTVKN